MQPVVLVTGATGFLGGAVLRQLCREGQAVIGLGRDPLRIAALRKAGFDVRHHDLELPFGAAALDGLGAVRAIVHCAALSAPFGPARAFAAANVTATRHVLDLGQALGVTRFVHASSASVCFRPADQLAVREDDPLPAPFNAYARTKAEAEHLVLAARGLGPVVLRPRGIYGAGETALLPRLVRAARRGPLPLLRNGRGRIDLTHVDDVVAAILMALQADTAVHGQVFNISGGEVLPITDIATRACAMVGLQARWRRMPLGPLMAVAGLVETVSPWLPRSGEPAVTRYGLALFAYAQSLDLSKTRAMLGWEPQISFDEGLARTFAKGPPP